MNIICKIKDYYDFVGYQNDSEDITFDRRNCVVLVDKNFEDCAINEYSIYSFIESILTKGSQKLEENMVGFLCGFNLHIFRVTLLEPISHHYHPQIQGIYGVSKFKYSIDYIGCRKCYNIQHDRVIDFVTIDTTIFDLKNYKLNSFKSWDKYKQLKKNKEFIDNDLLNSNVANWKINSIFDNYPIVTNTFIPKYISADIMYRNIEEWLIAQHNDVDQESKGITDVDKVINHGFDKKSSFRSVK